jgi:hypothetical protein
MSSTERQEVGVGLKKDTERGARVDKRKSVDRQSNESLSYSAGDVEAEVPGGNEVEGWIVKGGRIMACKKSEIAICTETMSIEGRQD